MEGTSFSLKPKKRNFKWEEYRLTPFLTMGILVISFSFLFNRSNSYLASNIYFFLASAGLSSTIHMAIKNFRYNNNINASTKNPKFINNRYSFTVIDLGIIYFSLQIITLGIFPEAISFFYFLSVIALFFPLYSIYKQTLIFKKISTPCVLIAIVLTSQATINFIIGQSIQKPNNNWFYILPIFLIVSLGWFSLRSLLNKQIHLRKVEKRFKMVKQNTQFFIPFYKTLETLNDQPLTRTTNIIVGNPNASTIITLVIDPLNDNCKLCYKEIESLINTYPDLIAARIIFNISESKNRKLSQSLALWIYNAYSVNAQTGIRYLQEILTPDNTKIQKEYTHLQQQAPLYQLSFIKIHENWCAHNKITHVPAILINNRLYPMAFEVTDLKHHIKELVKKKEQLTV